MPVREFNIPFGPDLTGSFKSQTLKDKSSPVEPSREAASHTFDNESTDTCIHEAKNFRSNIFQTPVTLAYNLEEYDRRSSTPRSFNLADVFDDEPMNQALTATNTTSDSDASDVSFVASAADISSTASSLPSASSASSVSVALDAPVSEIASRSASAELNDKKFSTSLAYNDARSDAHNQVHNDVQTSFRALAHSFNQSRELKNCKIEIQEFQAQLRQSCEELKDRRDILANFEHYINEQDRIIATSSAKRNEDKKRLDELAYSIQQNEEELEQMRAFHAEHLQPLESELGRAKAGADQAKNDERSRKAELNAAETELRRAGNTRDAHMLKAKLEQIRAACNHACDISSQAADILSEVQRLYDDALDETQQREGPLERALQEMQEEEQERKEHVALLAEDISAARARRQFCQVVYQYPEETERLQRTVDADKESLADMIHDMDELEEMLAQSKSNARKAKLSLSLALIILLLILIAFVVVFTRI